jgi:hypothetical protein
MKIALFFLFSLLLLVGCKKDDFIPLWIHFINSSGYDITLKSRKDDSDIILKNGERKDVATKYGVNYDVVPATPTSKVFEFISDVRKTNIISYDYKLEYIVEGTAEKADIDFLDENQGSHQLKNVSLPAKFQYKSFCLCQASVSAKRVGNTGSVTVTLFKRGWLIKSATNNSSAPASVYLDNWY